MNWSLLYHFTRQDLLDRYSGSVLGGLWTFILPLVNILIFTLVFSKIMGARMEAFGAEFSEYNYSIYLVAGMLAWNAFSATVNRVTNIFSEKSGLIAKVNMSLLTLPLYVVISETVVYLISMAFFTGFLLIIGFPLSWHWLIIPVLYIAQQLFAYALGFILAVLSVFIRDVREFVNVILQIWFWLTPIVYVVSILPKETRDIFLWNPMSVLIDAYRDAILLHQWPDMVGVGLITGLAAVLLAAGATLFGKLEKDIRDFI
ncbi:MAG: ABC transporter permease [Proteobacteria bacterium]|nr:MAG: ABC transporter permease [Pseudomonadota bacterium]